MTANAFDEDRQRCLDAGMNDHVAKPVEPQKLYQSLVKWLPERQTADEETPRSFAAETESGEDGRLTLLNSVAGLDVAAGLNRLMGNVPQYVRLLEQFVDRHGSDPERLADQIGAGDLESVRQTAHALKGVAGMLGAGEVQAHALALETAAREGQPEDVLLRCLASLSRELDNLLKGLGPVLSRSEDQRKPGEADAARADEILARLEPMLIAWDTEAARLFDQWESALTSVMSDAAKELGRQIRDFDYDDALKTVKKARKAQS